MIKIFVKILELLGDRLEVCVSVYCLDVLRSSLVRLCSMITLFAISLLTYIYTFWNSKILLKVLWVVIITLP